MRRSKRAGAAIAGGVLVMSLALTGCSKGETADSLDARVVPAILAVPGVTGGEAKVKNASLSHLISCHLTSDAADEEELKSLLTDVLRTVVNETPDEDNGTMVICSVSNGSETVNTASLGLRNPSWLEEVRGLVG